MRQYILIISLLFVFIPQVFYGQSLEIPTNVKYEEASDYELYVPQVIEASKWLIENPVILQKDKRKRANAFVFNWIEGSPHTNIKIRSEYVGPVLLDQTFEYQQDIFMSYIAGMTYFKLADSVNTNEYQAQLKGVKSMVDAYKSVRGLKKNSYLEKLYKQDKKGKLDEWLTERWIENPEDEDHE